MNVSPCTAPPARSIGVLPATGGAYGLRARPGIDDIAERTSQHGDGQREASARIRRQTNVDGFAGTSREWHIGLGRRGGKLHINRLAAIELRDALGIHRGDSQGEQHKRKQAPRHQRGLLPVAARQLDTPSKKQAPTPENGGCRPGTGGETSALPGKVRRNSGNWYWLPVKSRPLPSSIQPISPRARKMLSTPSLTDTRRPRGS